MGKSPAVATAESLAEAGDLSTAVVTAAVLGRVPHQAATQDTRLVLHGWWHPAAVLGGAEAGARIAA